MRRAARRDGVEPDIVELFQVSGWTVLRVSVKDGPDFFASKKFTPTWLEQSVAVKFATTRCVAVECKTGKRKLRPGQEAFRRTWQGEYVVLRTVDEAAAFLREP
jgi:hypothetical protein